MASIIARRCAFSAVKRCLRTTSLRTMSSAGGIPGYVEHAAGTERVELEKLQQGNRDPFQTEVKVKSKGTMAQPIEIPSFHEKRIVGCICEDDQTFIRWMWLFKANLKDVIAEVCTSW